LPILLIENAIALIGRVHVLARGRIVLEASTTEHDLPYGLQTIRQGAGAATPASSSTRNTMNQG